MLGRIFLPRHDIAAGAWWNCSTGSQIVGSRGGMSSVSLAEGAVDLMESLFFRSFAAVNGLRPPEAARKSAPLTASKLRKFIPP
jgi:hypothetical protein